MQGGTSIIKGLQISLEIGMIILGATRTQQNIALADIAATGVIRKGNRIGDDTQQQMRRQFSHHRHRTARDRRADLACGQFVVGDLRDGFVHVGLQVLACAMTLHCFNVVFSAHQVRCGSCSHR